MAQTCPNCQTCTCTGTKLVKANDGKICCTRCVNIYNSKIKK